MSELELQPLLLLNAIILVVAMVADNFLRRHVDQIQHEWKPELHEDTDLFRFRHTRN